MYTRSARCSLNNFNLLHDDCSSACYSLFNRLRRIFQKHCSFAQRVKSSQKRVADSGEDGLYLRQTALLGLQARAPPLAGQSAAQPQAGAAPAQPRGQLRRGQLLALLAARGHRPRGVPHLLQYHHLFRAVGALQRFDYSLLLDYFMCIFF